MILPYWKTNKAVQYSTSADDEANQGLPRNDPDPATRVDDVESRHIAAVLREQYGSRRRTAAIVSIPQQSRGL